MNLDDVAGVLNAISRRRLALALFLFAVPLTAQTALIEKGRAALDRDDPQAAVGFLQRGLAETPNNADGHYFLGIAYGNLAQKAALIRRPGLARSARDEFERAVSLNPSHLDARWSLVEYYMLAPSYLGGGERKAREQAREISKRDAPLGRRALDFIIDQSK